MVPIASEESTKDEGASPSPPDPLRRVIHVALAIYLTPVIAIVCAIGGVSILFNKASLLARRFAIGPDRRPQPKRFAALRPEQGGVKPPLSGDHRRARVGR
jgi:hypothetical protein